MANTFGMFVSFRQIMLYRYNLNRLENGKQYQTNGVLLCLKGFHEHNQCLLLYIYVQLIDRSAYLVVQSGQKIYSM